MGLAVSTIDFRTLMVPTRIVWPAFAVMIVLCAIAAGVEGEWERMLSAVIGLAVVAGPLFVLWFVMPKNMGFGDVRLAVLLGWTVGFFAGDKPAGALILGLIYIALSSIIGIIIGVVGLGARGRKAKVPFGPSMVIAAYLCVALASQILDPFNL